MGLVDGARAALARWAGTSARTSQTLPLDFQDWVNMFSFGNNFYSVRTTYGGQSEETIEQSFTGMINGAYKANGVVFAVMLARLSLFSEARFQFRQRRQGRPGDLFGSTALAPLETPWPNGTTGDLLSRMIQHADLAGTAFVARRPGGRLRVLRPDWVTVVLGSDSPAVELSTDDLDAEIIGYIYHPGGRYSGNEPVTLLAEDVAQFAPVPDPIARYRGVSWLTPIIREIQGDLAASAHKLKFFENGATPNMVVSLDPAIQEEEFNRWVAKFAANHEGIANAYRTLYLGAGAKVQLVGSNLQQLDFKVVQGAGETRIAAAGGVPPIIVGLSEGLSSATYSNYGQARRRFADGTMRPLWRNAAASLATLITVPANAELWYDDRDIPFLAEDVKDAAEIQQLNAGAIRSLIDAGFVPASVISAVTAGDLNRLQHSGLYSVQLQPPQPEGPPAAPEPPQDEPNPDAAAEPEA
jgi:phage portal protein BeeE